MRPTGLVAPTGSAASKQAQGSFCCACQKMPGGRLWIGLLVREWPSEFSIICSYYCIEIHKSLTPVMSWLQCLFSAHSNPCCLLYWLISRGSTSWLTVAAFCKLWSKKEYFFNKLLMSDKFYFLTPERLLNPKQIDILLGYLLLGLFIHLNAF